MFFRRRNRAAVDPAEARFQAMVDLIKDLPRKDYNRLKKAMDKVYDGYADIREVKTEDEREVEDVAKIEKTLDKISKDEGKEVKK